MTLAPVFFGQIPAPAPPGGAGAKIFRFWESATHLIFISIRPVARRPGVGYAQLVVLGRIRVRCIWRAHMPVGPNLRF